MNTKQGQFWFGAGLIDASTLPKWLLYPLIIVITILIIVVTLFLIKCLFGNSCTTYFSPFGMWGFMPFSMSSATFQNQHCYINDVEVNCSEIPDKEHFCNNGICKMNGVCNDYNNLNCIDNSTI